MGITVEEMVGRVIEGLGPFDQVRVANHWVPVTYLKSFTEEGTDKGRAWLYSRDAKSLPRRVGIAGLAKANNLYVEEHFDIPDLVERVLAVVEAPFDSMRRKLVGGWRHGIVARLTAPEQTDLSLYLSLQQLRTPAVRTQIRWLASYEATFNLCVKLSNLRRAQREFRVGGKILSRRKLQQWREQLENDELRIEPSNGHWLTTLLDVSMDTFTQISKLPFRVVRATTGMQFSTSDSPVTVVQRTRGTSTMQLSPGWMKATAEGLFPLDPQHVLVIGPNANDSVVGTPVWCVNAREAIISNANRFVFSVCEDPSIGEILVKTSAPSTVLEYAGQQFRTDQPVAPAVKAIFSGRDTLIRYGPR